MGKKVRNVLGLLVAALITAAGGLLLMAHHGLTKTRDIPLRSVTVASDSQTIARGHHLATVIMKCPDCHGTDFGGRAPFADAGPLGVINAPNLTSGPGGQFSGYDDATIARTIRHGIKRDGSPILIMPADAYLTTSDADMAAVIAYLRSAAPVGRVIPPSRIKLLGRFLYAAGQFPIVTADLIDHDTPPAADQVPNATAEYGRYLANIGGCTGCHGPGLSGGKIPGTPPDWRPATNISPDGLKGWSELDFIKALKTGVRPNGVPIDTQMPWRLAGQMDSTELRAVWLFLQSMPPKPFGGR